MDWLVDNPEGEEALAIDQAFTLIHEAPAALVAGQSKAHKAKAASQLEDATRHLQLAAFPELFAKEPPEQRLARAAAAGRCWDAMAQHIQDTLDGTDAGVFADLLRFAQQSHRPPVAHVPGLPEFAGCQRLPAGLVLAGGVNSADHCHTFPRLAAFLRQGGCYTALMRPHSFGKVPGEAFGEVLRQVSGLTASKAEHVAALVEWYRDETGADRQAPGAASAAAASAAAVQLDEQDAGASPAPDPAGKDGQEQRTLRQRPPAAAAGRGGASSAQLRNRQRPVVVILEGTESVDVQCLRDFILAASEAYQEVPVTLLLGLTTSAAALNDLLDSEVRDRCLQLQHFKLASAIARLGRLVQHVLLGGGGRWPGLVFSQAIIGALTDEFLHHYYSAGCITQGLKVAALSHFQTQPLSFLAVAALEGPEALEEACASLDPATLAQARKLLPGRTAAQLAAAVAEAMEVWSRWAVGAQWLVAAAEAAGLHSPEYRPWKLAESLLDKRFAAKQLKQLLSKLESQLRRQEPAAVQQLAVRLQQLAEAVHGGTKAAADHLCQLAAFAAGEPEAAAAGAEQAAREEQAEEDRQQAAASLAAAQAAQEGAEEEADAADQQGDGSKGKKRRKHDRVHSKDSRRAALLRNAAQRTAAAAGGKAGGSGGGGGKKGDEVATAGARLVAWLAPALRFLLAVPPTELPGALVFTCRDATALDCLTAEPRAAVHAALTQPHHFLPGLPPHLGFSADQEDAVLAYSMFDQDPKCANLADWYESFAAVHLAVQERADGAGASGSAANKRNKAAVKKAKKGGSKEGDGEEGQSEERRRVKEVAARFSQATAELQYVGLIKPSKRRRGDWVQRLVHQPAAGGES